MHTTRFFPTSLAEALSQWRPVVGSPADSVMSGAAQQSAVQPSAGSVLVERLTNNGLFACNSGKQLLEKHRSIQEIPPHTAIAIQVRSVGLLLQLLHSAQDRQLRSIFLVPYSLDLSEVLSLCKRGNIPILLRQPVDQKPDTALERISIAPAPDNTATQKENLSTASEANPPSTAIILSTSGTSSTPKLVPHTWESLTRSISRNSSTGATRENQSTLRWGLLYDPVRFAGLQVVLRALCLSEKLIVPDLQQPLEQQISFLIEHRCNALSATPSLWRKLLMHPRSKELALRQITLGGEIVDQNILQMLEAQFPQARLTHIYASTEAGVGFSVHDKKMGFPKSYIGSPNQSQTQLDIREGNLYIKQSGRSTAPANHLDRSADWIDTGDMVQLVGDRYHFLGRASGAINIGGNKVHPEEIEQHLLAIPEVQEAHVYGTRSPILGTLVTAQVVLNNEALQHRSDIPSSDLQSWSKYICDTLRGQLPPHKVPVKVTIVPEITLSKAGKIERS